MQFHAEFFPAEFKSKINLQQNIMLIGSCFTEQIGTKLKDHKFNIQQNPHGILFNPVSILKALESYTTEKVFDNNDLFYHNELWKSWDHHSCFSDINAEHALDEMNVARKNASTFLAKADWMIITLGSAFVYARKEVEDLYESVVANCHKVPADTFNRQLLNSTEIRKILEKMISTLKEKNRELKIIFTVSPVRHLREGFIENNRSKAALIEAVHSVVDNANCFYFPSYELIIDDLRDYRFYAEDLVHPNYSATNYVWEKFTAACIDPGSVALMKEISVIRAARNHKPFNKDSEAHKNFLKKNLDHVIRLSDQFPFLDLTEEERFFSS